MKIPTKLSLAFLLLFVVPLMRSLAQESEESSIPWAISGGWNIVEGSSYRGKSYDGTVDITTGADAFNFHWMVGTSEYTGVGLGLGGYVGVGWGTDGRHGVVIYKILSDSLLEGSWVASANDFPIGHERAHGGRLARNKGTFIVEGTNPVSGTPYTGTLKLTRKGDVYDVIWKIGKDTFRGVGIRQGDVFVVGWSTTGDVGVVAYTFDIDHGDGRWAIPGGSKLGIEKLERRQVGATTGK